MTKPNSRPAPTKIKCVCCNAPTKKNKSHLVFDEYGQFRRIQFLLAECLGKQVVEVAGGQQSICSECLNQLDQNYAFKLKCSKTNKEYESEDNRSDHSSVDEVDEVDDETEDVDDEMSLGPTDETEPMSDEIVIIDLPQTQETNFCHTNKINETIIKDECAIPTETNTDEGSIKLQNYLESIAVADDENSKRFRLILSSQTTPDDGSSQRSDGAFNVEEMIEIVDKEIMYSDAKVEPIDDDESHEEVELLDYVEILDAVPTVSKQESPDYLESIFADATDYNYSNKEDPTAASPTIATSFIESLTVHSVKEIIRKGIPTHRLLIPPKPKVMVKKNRQLSRRTQLSIYDGVDEDEDDDEHMLLNDVDTFVPKLKIEQVNNDEAEPVVDLDEYVSAIASVSFCEFSPFIGQPHCKLCIGYEVVLENYTFLVEHTQEYHTTDSDLFECCLGVCEVFASQAELNNHYFLVHGNIINAHTFLTCQTCDMGTESLVKFGKHICFLDAQAEQSVDNKYNCKICDQNLISRRRSSFHQQFHLENARPKLCLVCDIVFRDEKTFYEHVMFSHDEFAQYFCRFCDKSFTIESELKRHEHSHTADRPFACSECDKTFFDNQSLSTHKLIHQPGFTCEHCDQHYTRKSRLRKHILTAHVLYSPEILPLCGLCGQVFANEEKADRHRNSCQDENAATDYPADQASLTFEYFEQVWCCEFCEKAFGDLSLLLQHKKLHTGSNLMFECQYCDYRYHQYSRLKTHSNAHPEAKHPFPVKRFYVCEIDECNKPYADWNNFQNHRKTVHLINPSIIKCTQCDAVFYKSWAYAYHKKSVHNDHHKCAFCDQTFVIERALKDHVQRVHSRVLDEDTAADDDAVRYCDGDVVQHTKRRKSKHTAMFNEYFRENEVGEFSCQVCGKVTNRRSNAIAHAQMMHQKIRNFKCALCAKEFFHRGDLNGHMRKHNLETPYKCPHCEHSARNKSMLTLHLRKHTNERPFKCDQCPKAFKRSMVLKNHKKLHGDKEIKCEICGALFYTNYTLQNHHRMKHRTADKKDPMMGITKTTTGKVAPSIIIVMPGPKQADNRQKIGENLSEMHKNEIRTSPIDHKAQKVYILSAENR